MSPDRVVAAADGAVVVVVVLLLVAVLAAVAAAPLLPYGPSWRTRQPPESELRGRRSLQRSRSKKPKPDDGT